MPFWIGLVFGEAHELEMPLTEISDVAMSENGDLYFALTFAGRVQKYSSNGDFEKSFQINASGGSFCLAIIGDELAVYLARRDAEERYDLNGNSIRQSIPFNEFAYSEKCEWNEHIADVKSMLQHVTVSFANAENAITIERQPWHFIVFGPFISWITLAIGLFLIPEWRYAIFSAFARSRDPNNDAKPEGVFLKIANFVLNLLYTLYGLIFTAIGGFSIMLATQIDDLKAAAFTGLLGSFFIGFSIFWIYKLWTSYDSTIRVTPGIEFEVGPAGLIAWKALGLLLLGGFIFAVFYFGSNAHGAIYAR